jgi:DNA-directed RNA polymerase specialized sigma subunit, sigma24 homolog
MTGRFFNKRLKFILSRLPREQLACYSLRYEEEMSIADIANILDCPEGTVKSRLSSAMTTISKYIKEYNFIYED